MNTTKMFLTVSFDWAVSDQDTMLQKVSEVQTSTSRPASVRRCGNCKMPGHNRRSCNVTMSS